MLSPQMMCGGMHALPSHDVWGHACSPLTAARPMHLRGARQAEADESRVWVQAQGAGWSAASRKCKLRELVSHDEQARILRDDGAGLFSGETLLHIAIQVGSWFVGQLGRGTGAHRCR